MTINSELRAEILRLYHAEKWRRNTIARQLRVHHSTVRRVIEQEGQAQLPRARAEGRSLPAVYRGDASTISETSSESIARDGHGTRVYGESASVSLDRCQAARVAPR